MFSRIIKNIATFALILFVCIPPATAQIISVYAGQYDSLGSSGDGGPATAAQLGNPVQIATDEQGNLYIDDYIKSRIRKVDVCGTISTFAGTDSTGYNGDGIPATSAFLAFPMGLVYDKNHHYLFISDNENYRVRRVNATGIITTVAGTGITGSMGERVPATTAQLGHILGLAVDQSGNLYICDGGVAPPSTIRFRIRKVDTAGIISTYAGNGTSGFSGDGGPATAAEFYDAVALAFDVHGSGYICDEGNNRIRKVDLSGMITTIAGGATPGFAGDGGLATNALLYNPTGIFVDTASNIYIADSYNSRIRRIDASGIITTIAGTGIAVNSGDGGPATAAGFYEPSDVVGNSQGNLFVAQYYSHVVRVFGPVVNHPPLITADSTEGFNLTLCANSPADSLNTLLAVSDSDLGQTETWALLTAPTHGVAASHYSATISGASLSPSGMYYQPAPGYTGADSLRFTVTDCKGGADTVTFRFTIKPLPATGTITGKDTVCVGDSILLADTATGGLWSVSNSTLAGVSASGRAMGLLPGRDTIRYTVTGGGCSASATLPLIILSEAFCKTGINLTSVPEGELSLIVSPNPGFGNFTLTLAGNAQTANGLAQYTITNLPGQTIATGAWAIATVCPINIHAPAGIYFVSVVTQDGRYWAKIVVR